MFLFFLFSCILQAGERSIQDTPMQIKSAIDMGVLDIVRLIELLGDSRSVYAAMPFDSSLARFAEDAIVLRGKIELSPLCDWLVSQQGSSLQCQYAISAIRRIVDDESCPLNVADSLASFVGESGFYSARVMAISFLSRSSDRMRSEAAGKLSKLLRAGDPNLRGLTLITLARVRCENLASLKEAIVLSLADPEFRILDATRYGDLIKIKRPLRLDAIRAYGMSDLKINDIDFQLKDWFNQPDRRLTAECGVALLHKSQLNTSQFMDFCDVLEELAIEELHGGFNDEQHERLVFNDFVFARLERDLRLTEESLAVFDSFSKSLLDDERFERRWGSILVARRNLGLPLILDAAFRSSQSSFIETSIPTLKMLLNDLSPDSTLFTEFVSFLETQDEEDLDATISILKRISTKESQDFLSEIVKRSRRIRSASEKM